MLSKNKYEVPDEVLCSINPGFVEQQFVKPVKSVINSVCSTAQRSFTISEFLTFEEQNLLVSNFPEFAIKFVCNLKHPHAYAAASRKLELAVLLLRLGVTGPTSLAGYDDYVCDVGGEFSSHLFKNYKGVHSCCPFLDVRDGQRYTTRIENLTRRVNSADLFDTSSEGITNARLFLSGDTSVVSSFYCANKAQDCPRTARYGLSLHSCYDISLMDFAKLMVNKNMYELYGTFLYTDLVLFESKGFISGVNCFFSIDESKDKIDFSFKNDSSMIYTHSLKNYLAFLTVNSFQYGGFSFVVELLENRSGVQFFKITRVNMITSTPLITRFLWMPFLEGKTRVNFFDVDQTAIARGDFKNAFPKVSFFVDTAIIDKVSSHAYASTESKFRPVEIFNFLLAYNGRIFFGSDVCVRNKQLPVYQAMLLANAIYIDIFRRKYKLGKINQFMLNAVKHDRELSEKSLFRKIFSGKFTPPDAYGTGHSSWRIVRWLSAPAHAFFYWYRRSPYTAHAFLEENLSFLRCDTNLVDSRFSILPVQGKPFTHSVSVPSALLSSGSVAVTSVLSRVLADYYPGASVCDYRELIPLVVGKIDVPLSSVVPDNVITTVIDFMTSPLGSPFINLDSTADLSSFDVTPEFLNPTSGKCLVISNDYEFVVSVAKTGVVDMLVWGLEPELFSPLDATGFSKVRFVVGALEDVLSSLLKTDVSDVVLDDRVLEIGSLLPGVLSHPTRARVHFRVNLRYKPVVLFNCLRYIRSFPSFISLNKKFFIREVSDVDYLKLNFSRFLNILYNFLPVVSSPVVVPVDVCEEVYSDDSVSSSVDVFPDDSVLSSVNELLDAGSCDGASSEFSYYSCVSSVDYPSYGFISPVDCSCVLDSDGLLQSIEDSDFSRVRKLLDVSTSLDSSYVSRSAGKLLEMKGFLMGKTALDLCASPGGFSQVLLGLGFSVDAVALPGTTVVDGVNKIFCDLFSFGASGSYDVIVADGAPPCSDSLCSDIEGSIRLMEREYEVALSVSHRFTTIIMKLVIAKQVLPLLTRISRHERFHVFRPATTRGISTEFYVIFGGEPSGCAEVGGYLHALEHNRFSFCNFFRSVVKGSSFVLPEVDYSLPSSTSLMDSLIKFVPSPVVSDACPRSLVVDNDCLLVSRVGASDVALLASFCHSLPIESAKVRPGKRGRRLEWLFGSVPYNYSGEAIYPFGPMSSFLKDLAPGFNGCLVVFYPGGTTGLGFHSDTEEGMASDSVLTFSSGSPFLLKLRDVSTGGITDYSLTEGHSYLLKHQRNILHSVDVSGPRFALTFRNFVIPSVPLLGTLGDGNCLFYALVGNDRKLAALLRKYLYTNAPVSISVCPGYCQAHVLEECLAEGVWAGTATITLFCFLFNARVSVFSKGVLIQECCFVQRPTFVYELEYTGTHYDRRVTHSGDLLPFFSMTPISLEEVLGLISGSFPTPNKGFSVYPKLSEFTFVSAVQTDCLCSGCDCLNGLRVLVDQVRAANVLELCVLISLDSVFLKGFLDLVGDSLVRFVVYPGLINTGCVLVMVSFAETAVVRVDLGVTAEFIGNHAAVCVGCRSGVCVELPAFNHVTSTYFYCTPTTVSTVFVNSFEGASRVFRLRVMDNIVGYNQDFVISPDRVIVPVRVITSGVISDSRANVSSLRRAISKYFSLYGSVPCVGVESCGLHDISVFVTLLVNHVSRVLVLKEEYPSESAVDFAPAYVATVGDDSYLLNSMLEAREYYRAQLAATVNGVAPLHCAYNKYLSATEFTDLVNNRPDYALIDMQKASFVVRPKDGSCGPYNYAFDGVNLVDISSAVIGTSEKVSRLSEWLRPGVFKGLFSVTKDTKLVNGEKIFRKLNSFDLNNFSLKTKINLIEGVPGCGKTYHIINNHDFSLNNTDHIVLTSSREAAMDLRRRIVKSFGCPPDHRALRLRYRTVDSFLMHYEPSDYSVDTVWLDEGLMKHFGDVLWVAYITQCRQLNIIGDRAQIQFLNRVAGIKLSYHLIKLSPNRLTTVFLDTTHRCPQDVAVVLNRLGRYPSRVFSSSLVRRSLHAGLISSASEMSRSVEGYQILVFTQGEKQELSKLFGKGVFTVNEFQGNQASKVMLFRTNPKDISVFSSEPHILVAISRHTEEFVYVTVTEDYCFRLVTNPISSTELSEVSRSLGGGLVMGKTQTRQFPIYKVCVRPATMVDMLKQNKLIRDFVQSNLGFSVVPLRVDCLDVPVPVLDCPVASPYFVSDPLTTMQYFFDEILPGHSVLPNDFDDKLFVQDELFFATREAIRFSTYEKFQNKKFDSLSPSLRTSCPTPISTNLKQVLKAFYDRNGSVPVLNGLADDQKLADGMFDRFVQCYISDVPLFNSFVNEPVTVNVDSIEDWLFTQPSGVAKTAFSPEFVNIFNRELNKYSLILKKLPKPKLDLPDFARYPSPQTIAHSTKDVNAVFCPIIREIKKRLYAVLRPNVVVNSDMSVADLERILDVRLPSARVLRKFKFLHEVDIKKYDKSQGRVALLYEIRLLSALGFPAELIPTWVIMHVYTRLYDHFNKFVANICFQRKSGDPFTFLGNTLFLMGVIAYVYCLLVKDFCLMVEIGDLFLLFAGDDSLFFSPVPIPSLDISHELANSFNLESKLLDFKIPYFCSKFFLITPWGWKIVPDVLRMLVKLGRHDLVNYIHVDEYRVSCLDVGMHFGNSLLYPFIDEAFVDRYPTGQMSSFGCLYSAMYLCFSSVDIFRSLYFATDSALIDVDRKFSKLNDF